MYASNHLAPVRCLVHYYLYEPKYTLMKHLLLLIAFLPIVSLAQKWDISGQVGINNPNVLHGTNPFPDHHQSFSYETALRYNICRHLAVSVSYDRNEGYTRVAGIGIGADYMSKHFFAGGAFERATVNDPSGWTIYNNPAYGFDLHAGAKQHLSRHWSLMEQMGCEILNVSGKQEETGIIEYYPWYAAPTGPVYYNISWQLRYLYVRIGLAYKF